MSIRTVGDIQDEFLVRGNVSTSIGFVTDTILNDWTRIATLWSGATHKFPFSEGLFLLPMWQVLKNGILRDIKQIVFGCYKLEESV